MRCPIATVIVLTALGGAIHPARATAQRPDVLILDGEELSIYTNPLEPYLEAHPDARPKSDVYSTALWRGYIATWAIEDDRLFLIRVEIPEARHSGSLSDGPSYRDVKEDLFSGRDLVLADWFTGNVVAPTGDLVESVHMGYASTFSHYRMFRVENGRVVRRWQLDEAGFRKFRQEQFEAFAKTDEYRRHVEEMKADRESSDEEIRAFLFKFLSEPFTRLIFDPPRE